MNHGAIPWEETWFHFVTAYPRVFENVLGLFRRLLVIHLLKNLLLLYVRLQSQGRIRGLRTAVEGPRHGAPPYQEFEGRGERSFFSSQKLPPRILPSSQKILLLGRIFCALGRRWSDHLVC